MTEYIKREYAIEEIMSEPTDAHYPQWYAEKIKSIPAADVVPVVRCRECKYRFRNNGHDKSGCPIIDTNIWMDDDDFCSHGERKEGAD